MRYTFKIFYFTNGPMRKKYSIYYYFNDFKKNKEEIVDMQDVACNLNTYNDIFKALDSCMVSPPESVIDKIINFSKNMS